MNVARLIVFSFNIIRGSLLRFGLILCEKKNLDINEVKDLFLVFKTGSKFHLVLMLDSTTLWRGSQVCRGHCWKYGEIWTVQWAGV